MSRLSKWLPVSSGCTLKRACVFTILTKLWRSACYQIYSPGLCTSTPGCTSISAKLHRLYLGLPQCGESTCVLRKPSAVVFVCIFVFKSSMFLWLFSSLQPVVYCMCEDHVSLQRVELPCLEGVQKPHVLHGIDFSWKNALLWSIAKTRASLTECRWIAYCNSTRVCCSLTVAHVSFASSFTEPQSLFVGLSGLLVLSSTRAEAVFHRKWRIPPTKNWQV